MRARVVGIVVAIVIVLAVVGGLASVKGLQFKKMIEAGKTFSQPPESVSSFTVREEKWQDTLTAIGTVVAVQGVTVSPEVTGSVKELDFESGWIVQKGDLLVRLDTSSEEAQLRALEAQLELSRLNLDRTRKLREQKIVSPSDLEAAEATFKQDAANADAVRATIEKKTIRAPFSGKLGIRQINLGQYLDVGKPIVSLQSLTPVAADFSLPQQQLARLTNGMTVRLQTDTYPDRTFEGTLMAISPEVDQSTRSVLLQAIYTNSDQALRPGIFARMEVLLPEEKDVLVIPATSILSSPYGDSVYVIEPKPATNTAPGLVVRQQFVRTSGARGDFLSVGTGLKAGERVVSAGIFKLRNGMGVVENNALVPKSSNSPKPSDS